MHEKNANREIASLTDANLVVVKIGSRVLTTDSGCLNFTRIQQLVKDIDRVRNGGRNVVLVSSGAVSAGLSHLGWTQRPHDVALLQAVAAIGQTKLIEEYDRHFRALGHHVAQVLLTAGDLDDRARYLNIRNTLLSLLKLKVIPIINENDTVAVEELMITFGDNDQLAAIVANLLNADAAVILSDVTGLYGGDPNDPSADLIPLVESIDDSILKNIHHHDASTSKGGMASKLSAAKQMTAAGKHVVIASGYRENVLHDIFDGQSVGTRFLPVEKSVKSRKRWIGFSARPKGQILIDAGAAQALEKEGRSLLPIGITSVTGSFEKGDLVLIVNPQDREVARGLTNYAAVDLQRIVGKKSDQIAHILGHHPYDEAIHRDNLMLSSR